MKQPIALIWLALLAGCLLWLGGCSPEVGSEEWCAELQEKPSLDWTPREAADYTNHCLFRTKKN